MPPKAKKTIKRSSKAEKVGKVQKVEKVGKVQKVDKVEKKASIVSNASTKPPSSGRRFSTVSNASTKRITLIDRKMEDEETNTRSSITSVRKSLKKGEKRRTMSGTKSAKPHSVRHSKTAAELRLEEAIAEIVFRRSSSFNSLMEEEELSDVRSTDSKEYQLVDHPSKFIIDIESEDTSSEEPEYVAQGKLESEEDFFQAFGNVPKVDELSDDVSVKEEKKEDIVEAPFEISGDTGKFVNPLTGRIDTDASSIPSEEPAAHVQMQVEAQAQSRAQLQAEAQSQAQVQAQAQAQSQPEQQAKVAKSSTEEEQRSYKSTSSSDLSDTEKKVKSADKFEGSKSDVADAQDDDQETYLQFMELQVDTQKAATDELDVDVEALLKEQERLLNLEQTEDFLNNLIELCIQKAEFIDENKMLRRNLDKAKVTHLLKERLNEFYTEKKTWEFLTRKITVYFSRKNSARQMAIDDNPEERKKTYYEVLHRLDHLLQKEVDTKAMCSAQTIKCKEEYEEANESIQNEIRKLEQRIKSTFHNEKFDKLRTCVNRYLDKMSTIRKEISAVRLKLFLEQHLFSELSKQLTKLEDLGNGLNLKDYDNLETETKALGKKVEERNNILKKLHQHYDASIHNMAHLKEKKSVMCHVVEVQNEVLTKLQNQKSKLRTYITEMKREHNRARGEIRQMSFQSGLLDKPNLMVDYDRTVEMANELKMVNGTMKQTIEHLTHKIALLEERCATKNSQ